MSTKHTPGPWELDALGNVCSQAVHNIALVFASSTREGWSGSDLDTQAHCEANARLIAAAPELLEALSSLASQHSEADLREDPDLHAAVKRARAAIAKATGEQA